MKNARSHAEHRTPQNTAENDRRNRASSPKKSVNRSNSLKNTRSPHTPRGGSPRPWHTARGSGSHPARPRPPVSAPRVGPRPAAPAPAAAASCGAAGASPARRSSAAGPPRPQALAAAACSCGSPVRCLASARALVAFPVPCCSPSFLIRSVPTKKLDYGVTPSLVTHASSVQTRTAEFSRPLRGGKRGTRPLPLLTPPTLFPVPFSVPSPQPERIPR